MQLEAGRLVRGLGFKAKVSCFQVHGQWFGVYGSWFRVWVGDLGKGVWDLEFEV